MDVIEFFSSPIGLGHVTRDIAIANNFEKTSINFVTGIGAAKLLKNSDFNVQDVYNPPSFMIENGKLKNPAKWLWNYYQYYKDCKISHRKLYNKIIQMRLLVMRILQLYRLHKV